MPAPFAYNANIPAANDQISVSQGQLQTNCNSVQAIINVNHIDFASADAGKHKFITLPVQAVAPVFNAGEIGFFNKLPAAPFPLTTVNELFLTKSNGQNTPITACSRTNTGYTYLPSGILIKWGFNTFLSAGAAVQTFLFPVTDTAVLPVPGFIGVPFSIMFEVFNDGANNNFVTRTVGGLTNINFSVSGSQRTTTAQPTQNFTFSWVCIGYGAQ